MVAKPAPVMPRPATPKERTPVGVGTCESLKRGRRARWARTVDAQVLHKGDPRAVEVVVVSCAHACQVSARREPNPHATSAIATGARRRHACAPWFTPMYLGDVVLPVGFGAVLTVTTTGVAAWPRADGSAASATIAHSASRRCASWSGTAATESAQCCVPRGRRTLRARCASAGSSSHAVESGASAQPRGISLGAPGARAADTRSIPARPLGRGAARGVQRTVKVDMRLRVRDISKRCGDLARSLERRRRRGRDAVAARWARGSACA